MLEMSKFKSVLRDRGFKATPQRVAVHEAMMELEHACADEVSSLIRDKGKVKISDASVYNTLNQLCSMGIYSQRMSRNNKQYFDVDTGSHIHLYDRINNTFRNLEGDNRAIELVQKYFKGRRWRGYRFEDIEISLICKPTRKK